MPRLFMLDTSYSSLCCYSCCSCLGKKRPTRRQQIGGLSGSCVYSSRPKLRSENSPTHRPKLRVWIWAVKLYESGTSRPGSSFLQRFPPFPHPLPELPEVATRLPNHHATSTSAHLGQPGFRCGACSV